MILVHPDAPLEPLARQVVQAMLGALRHQSREHVPLPLRQLTTAHGARGQQCLQLAAIHFKEHAFRIGSSIKTTTMSSSSRASKTGKYEKSTTYVIGHVAESATHETRSREIAPDSSDAALAFRVRDDDGILSEVMMTEVDQKQDEPNKDPVIEHFVELRKYIEHSHEGLSKRLEKVEIGQKLLERKVDGGLERLERKVDAGFDRLGRKIDALAPVRRPASRRRKP